MSKKKAFSGSTMTLKDFHGGSIPSDLPLPSAPGVTFRSLDRVSTDRHRLRPGSSSSVKNFDDKPSFLSHTGRIGRNFDEDERKPLGAASAPLRTVSDENVYSSPARLNPKTETHSTRLVQASSLGIQPVAQGFAPISQFHGGNSQKFQAMHSASGSYSSGSSASISSGTHSNPWKVRKEQIDMSSSTCSMDAAVSKLANASAIEKVCSGRWQSKQSVVIDTNIDVVHRARTENGCVNNDSFEVVSGKQHIGTTSLAGLMERGLRIQGGNEVVSDRETPVPVNGVQLAAVEGNPARYRSTLQPASASLERPKLKLLPRTNPFDSSASLERPKLKLLPRTNPFDSSEPPTALHHKQLDTFDPIETIKTPAKGTYKATSIPRSESDCLVSERPKLNLKPRSQSLEQREEKFGERSSMLFGGARPREFVLKERGIEDGRNESRSFNPRIGKEVWKNEVLVREDRDDKGEHTKNWRSEKQQRADHLGELWRKPATPEGGIHYGKPASAVELAQAFSRPVSNSKAVEAGYGSSGLPFSRLVGSGTCPQINGY